MLKFKPAVLVIYMTRIGTALHMFAYLHTFKIVKCSLSRSKHEIVPSSIWLTTLTTFQLFYPYACRVSH